eukprot:TRINITY_DN53430_c0_g2_i1.p1 TRINITY_DN53430_c0_g2~~TRINITY_DN53430_c0_g2_i1.p1  ORF type:complete len:937 (+),score=22.30 TRINITY_DN53430_c0_g2_i1:2464-5274(+)
MIFGTTKKPSSLFGELFRTAWAIPLSFGLSSLKGVPPSSVVEVASMCEVSSEFRFSTKPTISLSCSFISSLFVSSSSSLLKASSFKSLFLSISTNISFFRPFYQNNFNRQLLVQLQLIQPQSSIKVTMDFINLRKIAFRLSLALILFQICNTYFLYTNFKETESLNMADRLKAASIEALHAKDRRALEKIANNYSLWHIYVAKKTDDGYELLRSSATPEEIASSSKLLLSDSTVDEALESDENPYILKLKNGFNNIKAMIYSKKVDGQNLVSVAELKLYENFLFAEPFTKALGQAVISLLIVIIFFVYIYLSFKRSTEHALEIVQDSKNSKESTKKSRDFLLNSVFDMVVVLDSSGRIVEVNDAFLKQGGYKKSDVLNTLFLNYVADEFLSDMKLIVYGHRSDIVQHKAEVAIKNNHSGVLSYCFMELLPFEDEYTYIILKDVTELKSTKRKLQKINNEMFDKIKESTNYSRFILDSEPNIIWVQNRESIVDANKAFFDFFSSSNRDIEAFNSVHKSVFEMFDVVDRPDYVYEFDRKDALAFLLTNRHKSYKASFSRGGKKYIFKINANYIVGGSGTNFVNDLFIVILTDITESEMIKDKEINLVRSSTIGKLAAGITHEINTPVTYMKGNFELLREELKDRENMDFEFVDGLADSIQDGLGRVESIVRSMKELNVKSTDNLEKIDVIDSISTAINMVQVRAKYLAQIYVKKEPSADISNFKGYYFAYASMQKLEQIWIIILNNALDEFGRTDMDYEDRRIDIEIDKDEFFVNVYVKDNAGGIPESVIDKIFDPMFSTKTSSGMGLGLNITKKIMESLKGTIIAYNDDNGAVFEVNIPIIKQLSSNTNERCQNQLKNRQSQKSIFSIFEQNVQNLHKTGGQNGNTGRPFKKHCGCKQVQCEPKQALRKMGFTNSHGADVKYRHGYDKHKRCFSATN